jgi:hypothetical protein
MASTERKGTFKVEFLKDIEKRMQARFETADTDLLSVVFANFLMFFLRGGSFEKNIIRLFLTSPLSSPLECIY